MNYQIQSDRLSPDATRMAFGKAVLKETDKGFGAFPPDAIYVRNIATTDAAELIVKIEGAEIHNAIWSPDGSKLAFTAWEPPGGIRNWVVDARTKKVQEVKLPRYNRDGKENSMTFAAWSPDGEWFAVADEGLLYLITMDMTGPIWKWSGRKRLTRERESILGGTCSFSPDGRYVIFTALHGDQRMSLQLAEVDGGAERTLVAAGSLTDIYACWSPDGQRVAYSAAHLDSPGKRAGRSGIYIVNADGTSEKPSPVLEEVHPPEIIRLRLIDWR
jgi:Tol biopolymer transport system component